MDRNTRRKIEDCHFYKYTDCVQNIKEEFEGVFKKTEEQLN